LNIGEISRANIEIEFKKMPKEDTEAADLADDHDLESE